MLCFLPQYSKSLALLRNGCVPFVSKYCFHLDLATIKLLPGQKGLQGLQLHQDAGHSGHLPSCSSGLLHGGKWVNIPFLKKEIAKHRVVLLEAGGKCLGTAFWWKWLR